MRPSTSASQASGSTSLNFAVMINVAMAAARSAPRSEPANSQDLRHLYGGNNPNDNRVPVGSRTIQVPIRSDYVDLSNCCDPCSSWNLNGGMMAAYKAGFSHPGEVPAMVVLGCSVLETPSS
jgi:hypothetical protein